MNKGRVPSWRDFIYFHDDVDVVRQVIDEGNVNAMDQQRGRPIHYAIKYGAHQTLDYLLECKADVTFKSRGKMSMLHEAVYAGNVRALKKLLALGCIPIDVRDAAGDTPLHEAIANNHGRCTRKLLKAGANPRLLRGNDNATTLDIAMGKYMGFALIKYLIRAGVWLNNRKHVKHCPQGWKDYRCDLAKCRMAQQAVGRALKYVGVNKDVIAIIQTMVWETRDSPWWTTCPY